MATDLQPRAWPPPPAAAATNEYSWRVHRRATARAVRLALLDTGNPWASPQARLAAPRASSSALASTDSPTDSSTDSPTDSSARRAGGEGPGGEHVVGEADHGDPGRCRPQQADVAPVQTGRLTPCGPRDPTTATPRRSRSKAATAPVAAATASSGPAAQGHQRATRYRPANTAADTSTGAGLTPPRWVKNDHNRAGTCSPVTGTLVEAGQLAHHHGDRHPGQVADQHRP